MARTFRRNKKHLIVQHCGTLEDARKDPWWYRCYFNDKDLTVDQAYVRYVARYTRDHRSGLYGVPNWYRREHGVFVIRREESIKLHRHLRNDCWESHLPESRMRASKYYWWY